MPNLNRVNCRPQFDEFFAFLSLLSALLPLLPDLDEVLTPGEYEYSDKAADSDADCSAAV